jgi:hypothetical protein
MNIFEIKKKPKRKRSTPVLERLETRDLPASLGPNLPGNHTIARDVAQFVPLLYPPGTPQPTPGEVARESFVAIGEGVYTVGPGAFNTQAYSIHGYGKSASSNMSRKARFQYVVNEPSTPGAPVTGLMHFLVANFLSSGGSIILDLQGPTGTEVHGLPTRLYWVHDATSGTTFTGVGTNLPGFNYFPSNYFNAKGTPANPPPGSPGVPPSSVDNWNLGLGEATFKYVPDKHPLPRTLGSGKVYVVFRGLINNSGAQNPIDKNYM